MNHSGLHNLMLLIGRLLASVLFIVSGYFKFVRYDFYVGFFQKLGVPMADIAVYAAGAFELAGALALILGFKTRPAAVLLGLYSIAAASLAHTAFGDFNQLTHFLKNLSILGGFLALGVVGAGDYSMDAKQDRTAAASETAESEG